MPEADLGSRLGGADGYEVAVLLGAVRLRPDHALIEIPWPGAPLLIDRVPMPG